MTYKTPNKILNPNHRVTIGVYGIGGTGSHVLTSLIGLDKSLKALGHPGIHVKAYDFDKVTQSNIGRQKFYPQDIEKSKAEILIKRINAIYGLDWKSYSEDSYKENIIVTCFDNVASRRKAKEEIVKRLIGYGQNSFERIHYWIDSGNSENDGQVIIGSYDKNGRSVLPDISSVTNDFKDMDDNPNEPSCSLAEALQHQDLMVNKFAADITINFIWKIFRYGKLEFRGAYFNLDKIKVIPIPIIPIKTVN